MILLKKNMNLCSKFFFLVIIFLPFWSKSLNVFEMSLIGVGSGVVFQQYFDRSLDKENHMIKKSKVIEKYYNSKKRTINSDEFLSMPIQQKLMIIEVYHSNKN